MSSNRLRHIYSYLAFLLIAVMAAPSMSATMNEVADYLYFDLTDDEIFIYTTVKDDDTVAYIDFTMYADTSQMTDGTIDKIQVKFNYDPDYLVFDDENIEYYNWDGDTDVTDEADGDLNLITITLDAPKSSHYVQPAATIYAILPFKAKCQSQNNVNDLAFATGTGDNHILINPGGGNPIITYEPDDPDDGGITMEDYDVAFSIHDTTFNCGVLGETISIPIYIQSNCKILIANSTVNYDTTKLEYIDCWLPDSSVWQYDPQVTAGSSYVTVNLSNYSDTTKPLQYDTESVHYYLDFRVLYDGTAGPWDGAANKTTLSFTDDEAGAFVAKTEGSGVYCLSIGYIWPANSGDLTIAEYETDFAVDADCDTCGSGYLYSGNTKDTVVINLDNSFPAGGAVNRLIMNIDLGDKLKSPDILDSPFDMDAVHHLNSNVLKVELDDNTTFDCEKGDLFRLELELDSYNTDYDDRFAVISFVDQYPGDTSIHSLLIDTTASVQTDASDHLTFTADSLEILQAEFSTTSASTGYATVYNYLKLRNNFDVSACTTYVSVSGGWRMGVSTTYNSFSYTKISSSSYMFYRNSGTIDANGDNYTTIAKISYQPPWGGGNQIVYTTPNINGYSAWDASTSHYISEDEGQVGANPVGADPIDPPPSKPDENGMMPDRFALHPNRPNPFNPTTIIDYDVPAATHVTIEVINILGQRVATLVDETKAPGSYEAVWNGRDQNGVRVSSGIYLYHMRAGDFTQTRKMMLMK